MSARRGGLLHAQLRRLDRQTTNSTSPIIATTMTASKYQLRVADGAGGGASV